MMTAARESPRVSRLNLSSFDELDGALELMYFGLKGLTRQADEVLAKHGLSRAHHRIIFVIARRDGVTVGDLQANLGISAQALHRPLKQLLDGGHVVTTRDPTRHRYKALHLTKRGTRIEQEASECERKVIREAFGRAGTGGRKQWQLIMSIVAENA